ncbi:MAG TPA: hypothetical protein VGM63_21120 [Mucilaginibacter sp.]
MIRLLFLVIGLLFLSNICFAQGNLTGRIYENKTRIPLAGISIQNLKSKTMAVSDQNGIFAIRAHIGDLVTFSGFSYQTDTLYVKDLGTIEIFLDPKQRELKGVTVTGSETRLGNLKAAPTLSPFGGETLVYQTDANGDAKGGLKLNLFDSHSDAKKRKKEVQLGEDEKTKQEIAKTFSPDNLKNYLPITGQEMDNFIIIYTPDINTYTDADFNLTIYIDKSYRDFLTIPKERRQSKQLTELNKSN